MRHSAESIYSTLSDIFARVFGCEPVELHAASDSHTIAGWDSFKYVQIIVELEEAYGIELDGPEIDEVGNLGDLVRLVSMKAAQASDDAEGELR